MKVEDIKVKITPAVKGIELCCMRCYHLVTMGDIQDLGNDTPRSCVTFDKVVLNEYVCEKCGCNTFIIDAFITVEIR